MLDNFFLPVNGMCHILLTCPVQNCFGSVMQEIQDDLDAGIIVTSLIPKDLE